MPLDTYKVYGNIHPFKYVLNIVNSFLTNLIKHILNSMD